MIELISQWVSSLIFAAAFSMLMLAITPEGMTRKALSFVCSIVCISVLIAPAADIDLDDYSRELSKYSLEAQRLTDSAFDEKEKLNRLYIEDECRAYILDKAKVLGAEVDDARVAVEWSTDGFWYPVSAEAYGSCTKTQKDELSRLIEAELGIASAQQKWEVSIIG